MTDNEATSNIATVHIKVVPMPTAQDAQFRVDSNGTARIDLRRLADDPDEDAEARLAISVHAPHHGQLIRKSDGVYVYKPDSGFTGLDTFSYTVSDGSHNATGTITVNVRADNDDDDGDSDGCGLGGWNSGQTIVVNSSDLGQDSDDQGHAGYGYLVINQGSRGQSTAMFLQPTVDWNGVYSNDIETMTPVGDTWGATCSTPRCWASRTWPSKAARSCRGGTTLPDIP